MNFPTPTAPPTEAAVLLRPLGYTIWGIAFLAFAATLLSLPIAAAIAVANGGISPESPQDAFLLVLGIPIVGFCVAIMTWFIFSQGMLGFVYAAQSLFKKNSHIRIATTTGNTSAAWLEPNISTPTTRLWAAIARVAKPDKWFYLSALAMSLGVSVALLGGPVTLVVGGAILAVGLGFHIPAAVRRLRVELAKRTIEDQ